MDNDEDDESDGFVYIFDRRTIDIKHEQFWLYKILLGGMDDDTVDKDRKNRLFIDLLNLLFDMGWPKKLVLEKLFADKFGSDLWRRYKEAEDKGVKPDYSKFYNVLDEVLHEKFGSDWFRQIKLKIGLDRLN